MLKEKAHGSFDESMPTTHLPLPSCAPLAHRFMAGIFRRALIQASQTLIRDPFPSHCHHLLLSPLPVRLLILRGRADRSARAELFELNLGAEIEETDFGVLRRIDDGIHATLIRKSAPDWLPFVPGSSYWVPPRRRVHSLLELIGKVSNPLTDEESMSLTTLRGWPSSAYFVEGTSPRAVKKNRKKAPTQSDDEE